MEGVGGVGWGVGTQLWDEPQPSPHGPEVRAVYADARVQVVSDGPVPARQAQALAGRIARADGFDRARERWEDEGPLGAPLAVAVLSREAFARVTGDTSGSVAGVTAGPNLMVLPREVLGRPSAMSEETLAHELGHVHDFRAGGARLEGVPVYLQEGKAYLLGERYALERGLPNPHLGYVARQLAQLDARLAERVMREFRDPSAESSGPFGFIGEVTGSLFVEFLRTRLGGGRPDALERVAGTVAAVGRGATYEDAFTREFGVSPAAAERAFVAYVRATEGRPDERLRGTVYAADTLAAAA